jgi:hypothetical protein
VLAALKPGGRWIVHVPNGASPFAGAATLRRLHPRARLTTESLDQLALSSGFRAVAFERMRRSRTG